MLNKTVLQGRLCADPELRHTESGTSVCSFRVAWSKTYKERETKLFLNCTAWRGTGEMVANYFHKGKEIVVEGELSTREWTDRDGNARQTIELTVDQVHFCGPKDGNGGGQAVPAGGPVDVPVTNDFQALDYDDSDLPF